MTDESAIKVQRAIKLVQIEWIEAGIAMHANQLLAQCDGSFAYLTFAQTTPPILMGTAEETQEQLAKIDSVKAIPIIKLMIPMADFRRMLPVLQKQIEAVDSMEKGGEDASSVTSSN